MEQLQQKKRGIVRRAAGGVGKAWAYSLGLTSLYREGQRIVGTLGALGAHVRHKLSDSPANYRQESFDDAVERLSLDEAHLIKQAHIFQIRSMSWLAALLLATVWLAWQSLSGTLQLQGFIVWLGLMSMTSAKSITWRFRFCQIRDQELYSFGPWFRNPGRW